VFYGLFFLTENPVLAVFAGNIAFFGNLFFPRGGGDSSKVERGPWAFVAWYCFTDLRVRASTHPTFLLNKFHFFHFFVFGLLGIS
jgi:hypothetical protein